MANLLNLKNRIKSVKNIGQITKAMELVAATKMKKAQQRALDSRKYSSELESLVKKLLASNSIESFDLGKVNPKAEKNLLIIVGPSKGLAGGLISNLSRETYKYLVANPNTDLIALDKKGLYIAEKSGKKVIAALNTIKTTIQQDELVGIYDIIRSEYVAETYKKVSIVYTHFINALVQKPQVKEILPIKIDSDESQNAPELIIEPSKQVVINELLQSYFENSIFVSILDSVSSEYSARMIAMKNANDNANEIKSDLTLEYNQTRQAAITQQILEIAGATAAMEGNE